MSTSDFEIDSVPYDIGFEEFHSRYFIPEKPVIIQGIGSKIQRISDLSIGNIREKIIEKNLATVNTFWFEGPAEMLDSLVDTPEVVERVLRNSHCRKNHCRLWLNGAGNLTPSHYDGNMLYVFNLQLRGRKEWRIISPHTPLRNYPFSRAALFKSGSGWPAIHKGSVYCDFALEEGDMVYLPPMWHHAVKATAASNININWVATRKVGHIDSKTYQRELELLKYALLFNQLTGRSKMLNQILGAGIENYLENFAGVGWEFIKEQTKDVGFQRVVLRFLEEVAFVGFALKDTKKLWQQFKKKPLDSLEQKPATPA